MGKINEIAAKMNEVAASLEAARKSGNTQEVKRLEATWNSLCFKAARESGDTSESGWWYRAYDKLRLRYGQRG